MKKYFYIILLLPFLTAFTMPPEITVSQPVSPTDYYCDLDAGVNGSGTSGSPWNSWANALSGMSGAGNPWRLNIKGSQVIAGTFTWTKSGSSGNEGVIRAWGASTATTTAYFRVSASYVIFDGLSQTTPQLIFKTYAYPDENFRTNSDSSYITLYRIELDGDSKDSTVMVQGDYIKIYNCRSHDHTASHNLYVAADAGQISESPEIRNNLLYNAARNGFQVNPHETSDTVNNLVVSGNAVYDNGETGIYVGATQAGGTLNGATIYNNICWGNAGTPDGGIHIDSPVGSFSNILVYNNSVIGNIEWGYNGGTLINNNYTSLTGSGTPGTSSNNDSSPSYVSVDDTNANYLKINASNDGYDTNPPVTIDYWGTSRDASAPDIGAMEYNTGDVTAPATTISTPDPQYAYQDSLAVQGNCTDAVGVTSVKFRLGSAPDASNGTSCTCDDGTCNGVSEDWTCTVTGMSLGSNTVYAGCGDAAANWGAGDSITAYFNYKGIFGSSTFSNATIR